MLRLFLCPIVYLVLTCGPVIHSKILNTKYECPDCIVSLDPKDHILQKYAQIVLKAVQNKNKQKLKIANIENASYVFSDGFQYEFTIYLTGILQKINQKCKAVIHQGYREDDINITTLKCNEFHKNYECIDCVGLLEPNDQVLQKYALIVLEAVQNRSTSNEKFNIVKIENPSYIMFSDGIAYEFTVYLTSILQKMKQKCKARVHQGFIEDDINITTLQCNQFDKNDECIDCVVPLDPHEQILLKYALIVLEAVQKTSKDKLRVVDIENASYMFSDGIVYEFTVYITGILQKFNKKCRARVHQGYREDDINITNLQCNEFDKVKHAECENCTEDLDPTNPFLQKYLMLVTERVKNITKTDLRLLAVEDISFLVSNGVIFNFTLHFVDTREELSIRTCNAIVHQGAKIEEVNITEVTCVTEKIPECVDCEVSLDPEDPILGKYVNFTIEELITNGTYLHLVGVKNATYRVSNGIIYKFTIILTYGDLLENSQVCDVVVHQGYARKDKHITHLLCVKNEQVHHCTDCEVSLHPDDPVLRKYVIATLKILEKKTGKTPQLTGIQQASYKAMDDGMLYNIIITIAYYGNQKKDNQACDATVHQGYKHDAINVTKLQCVKVRQNTECVDCVIVLEPDDLRLKKYINITLKELYIRNNTLFHLEKVKKASYQVSNGVLYKLTLVLSTKSPQMRIQTCDVEIQQGHEQNEVRVIRLQCMKNKEIPQPEDLLISIAPLEAVFQKYIHYL